ncbi:hypothetical protein J0J30_24520, partial [Vibrio vulnificus]|nr:hypothetical protein [Vibrio vulnificus]
MDEGQEDKVVYVGSHLPKDTKDEIVECLKKNVDIFAWSPNDMPGIDPQVISHRFNVFERAFPLKQKKR